MGHNTLDTFPIILIGLLTLVLPLLIYGCTFASGYFFARQKPWLSLGLGVLGFLVWALPMALSLVLSAGYFTLPGTVRH